MRPDNATARVDGNALAGLLAEIFEGEATVLVTRCSGCGSEAPIAEAVVELDEVAAIVRCRTCTHTLLTILRADGGVRVVFGMLGQLTRR